MQHTTMRQTTAGLSLVEVVVAVGMLITVLAISAGILSALGTTRANQGTAQAVNSAQQGAELIRGLWATDPVLYRGLCFNRQETPEAERINWPAGVRITEVTNLDIMGNSLGTVPLSTGTSPVPPVCTQSSAAILDSTATVPPLRQITVVSQGGTEPRTLIVQVGRP